MEIQWYAPFTVIVYIRTGSGTEYLSKVKVPYKFLYETTHIIVFDDIGCLG